MSKVNKSTKQGSLSQAFKAAAVTNPEDALAFMFMSAFGVSLATLCELATRVVSTSDVSVAILCMTAGVQIRNHVVFVTADFAGMRKKYPELVIEGGREQQDQFNYGALHALGHVLAHAMMSTMGQKILKKAGSCITGAGGFDNEAGKINAEIASGWSPSDRAAFQNWISSNGAEAAKFLDPVADSLGQRASNMAKIMNPGTTPPRPKPAT